MVETKNPEEPTLPTKRKLDLSCEEIEEHPNKAQKLQSLNNNSLLSENKILDPDKECVNSDAQVSNEEEEDDGDDDEDADGNGEVGVDRKGKGNLIENEEEEEEEDSSDDDDSSDGGSQSDGDSDLCDDPLAEVDLSNILPSRTRRRVIHPGEFVDNDLDDDEDSDSDDGDT